MDQVVDNPEWADRVTVNACMASDQSSVELVHALTMTGGVSAEHPDDILCRYTTPSQMRAVARYGGKFPQTVGKLMFVPAGVANHVEGPDQRTSAILCRFNHDWLAQQTLAPRRWSDSYLKRCANIGSTRADQAMQWLASEIRDPGMASNVTVEALTNLIAVELARHFELPSRSSPVLSFRGKLSDKQLERVRDYVRTKTPCPTIAELAQVCDCSYVHIRRLFKNSTGQTLHNYIEEVRLDRARDLLANTNLSVKDIASELGFAHASGFSNAFRKAVGCTALEYRFVTRR
jgi:AraC family transcriptional regulator